MGASSQHGSAAGIRGGAEGGAGGPARPSASASRRVVVSSQASSMGVLESPLGDRLVLLDLHAGWSHAAHLIRNPSVETKRRASNAHVDGDPMFPPGCPLRPRWLNGLARQLNPIEVAKPQRSRTTILRTPPSAEPNDLFSLAAERSAAAIRGGAERGAGRPARHAPAVLEPGKDVVHRRVERDRPAHLRARKAITATAHKLARLIYRMLRFGRVVCNLGERGVPAHLRRGSVLGGGVCRKPPQMAYSSIREVATSTATRVGVFAGLYLRDTDEQRR